MTQDINYFRVHRGAVDTDFDLLVPEMLTLEGLDFFGQRKKCKDHGTFFLVPYQYFSIRKYAAGHNLKLDEVLRKERGYERFDQVIDFSGEIPLVYTGPEIDFDQDKVILKKSVECPTLMEIPFNAGFLFEDLDPKAGLPRRGRDNWRARSENDERLLPWESYHLYNILQLQDANGVREIIKGFDYILLTPMFRARDGMDWLFIEPILNVKTAMPRYGVRECLFASPENLEKLRGIIIE